MRRRTDSGVRGEARISRKESPCRFTNARPLSKTLTDQQRAEIADGNTNAHVEITGAPFEFVHVTFPELPDGRTFTGGTPSAPIFIRGNIRAGRSDGSAGRDRSVPAMLPARTGSKPTSRSNLIPGSSPTAH